MVCCQSLGVRVLQSWFAVRCKPKEDQRAEENLARQGFDVFHPLARVKRRRQGKWGMFVESLFPGYVFVQLDSVNDNWAPIRSTRGVLGLVRFGGIPAPVPHEVIDEIRSQQDAEFGWLDLTQLKPMREGQRLRIIDGPFMGQEARFQKLNGQDRVLVLLNIMQQSVQAVLHRDQVLEAEA
ncbi:transcriptional antiterminator RfaH [Ectothiorhodosinus mongolicus]|uniref:Transcriptional antiterminator RfaH n=1 Tax=Ectothiorhodosinus mongolicus TaxID=233100 RepID=A0A1R3W2V5_9GAMM|nr:transcription/translation regulatory transformer protein RfaH [Ectothiorhodosinus mongolicus]SIT72021.1 transcriptional antiterminator RfaH [Ectothiorhodosinus mongolicus]